MNFEKLSEEIFSRYGNIKRAGKNFLYTDKGTRLTDLYRENGRGILGYRETTAFTMLKNALGRGVSGSYRTCETSRLEKAVCNLLNSTRKIFIFNSLENAIIASTSFNTDSFAVFKPWSWENIEDYSEKNIVLFEPALPWTEEYLILAVSKDFFNQTAKNDKENSSDSIFKTITINAPMSAAITRSIYDLIAAKQNLSEKDFFIFDKSIKKFFDRKGPWLFPKQNILSKENYDDFVLKCLDIGIVVNPDFDHPSIVPIGADKGILKKLEQLEI